MYMVTALYVYTSIRVTITFFQYYTSPLYYRGEAFRLAFNLIPAVYTTIESKSSHKVHLLALTATATKKVERDVMVNRLEFPKHGYNRYAACPVNENVYLAAHKVGDFHTNTDTCVPHTSGTLINSYPHCSTLLVVVGLVYVVIVVLAVLVVIIVVVVVDVVLTFIVVVVVLFVVEFVDWHCCC